MKQKAPLISVVIAAYNEKDDIEELTRRIDATFRRLKIPYKLIYSLAGTDGTADIVKRLTKKFPIYYIYSEKPGGLGHDFRQGFSCISPKSTYVLTMDADLNHHPEEIPRFLDEMKKNNPDFIIGSREVPRAIISNIPLWKRFISKLANIVFDLKAGSAIKDKTSGYRLYKKGALEKIMREVRSKNFEFLMEMLIIAKRFGMNISEVPITFTYRVHGKSKMNLFKTGKGYLRLILTR